MQEDQIVDGLSYTDSTKNNFDCGRFKSREKPVVVQTDVMTNILDLTKIGYSFCGATIINDRSEN